MSLFRSSASVAGMLARSGAATCRNFLPAAYHSSTVAAASQSDDPLGTSQREGRVEGAFDHERSEVDTYYATDSYPGTASDKAGSDGADAASKGHPQGNADTSSMNDPAGKGREPAGNEHVHHPGRPDAESGASKDNFKTGSSSNAGQGTTASGAATDVDSSYVHYPGGSDTQPDPWPGTQEDDDVQAEPSPRTSVETFPGKSFDEGMTQPSGLKGSRSYSSSSSSAVTRTFQTLIRQYKLSVFPDSTDSSSSSSSLSCGDAVVCGNGVVASVRRYASQGSTAGEASGGDLPNKKEPERAVASDEEVQGGTGSPIAGSWRAVTADFAAGGDDMTGGGSFGTVEDDMGMKVNADSGLPTLNDVDDAGAHSAGFGAQRDPTESGDQEYTARQTEKSTGQDAGSAD